MHGAKFSSKICCKASSWRVGLVFCLSTAMTSRHHMDSSQHAVKWHREGSETRPKQQDPDAIEVLNDAFRSATSKKFSMVSIMDEEPQNLMGDLRFVSASSLKEKPPHRSRPAQYQGSAMATLSSMLADGQFNSSDDECEEPEQPPARPVQHGSLSRRGSKSGIGGHDATATVPQCLTAVFGPPDPSLYSPLGAAEAPQPVMRSSGSLHGLAPGFGSGRQAEAEGAAPTLSNMLDKFAAEEETGPIIRNKNYIKQVVQSQGGSVARSINSLAHLRESYKCTKGSGSGSTRSRGTSVAGDPEDVGGSLGEEDDTGAHPLPCRLSTGLSSCSASDALHAASEALSSVPRPPRGARPSIDALAAGSNPGSRTASPVPGHRPGCRPVDKGLVSSMTDLQALQEAPGGGRSGVVFSSVSALPPLAGGGQGSGTPPRPRQPPRAASLTPSPPQQPQPPQGERVLSRNASPARGTGRLSRDPSPARPVPRMVGSREPSPSAPRPLAPTEIVAAAVAEIAAAGSSHHYQPSRVARGDVSSPNGSSSSDAARLSSAGSVRPGGGALRPPKPASSGATGSPTQHKGPAPSSWDVALRDASPSRMPSVRRGALEEPEQARQSPAQPAARSSGPLLRSRDSSPLRSSSAMGVVPDDMDPQMVAEMLSGNVLWRLPLRMGVATQSTARVSSNGRTSRDASPDTRNVRSLTDDPVPYPSAPANPGAPARPPKPLTKPPNWGRGGDPNRGVAPACSEGSGLGNSLPNLVQAHVFMQGGNFDLVHDRSNGR